MVYEDKVLNCRDCGKDFVFTAGEQEFFSQRGFENQPTRCPECRKARKMQQNGGSARQMYDAVCTSCGAPCKVPFQPSGDKPVYCSDCFSAHRTGR
ncbi:MAG TPA: zinc-ribbon domain containing protein [Bacillota bacterium]|nr:MAG: hypothetical protein BWY00_01061 [Firmicutes bacterium ADurb.Bin153]HOH10363.1 zinc-ribbon domain containing protein [Bacillota bacterium]HOY89746.1 zinc-ribbon domain containing protein [Bacillota bacterium]HPI01488.1 zinc-ribbon domain containing protein [Bacillota bacterium]HPM63077.1 zinc-ribbon domain containing protein [Bacillota bacterium]